MPLKSFTRWPRSTELCRACNGFSTDRRLLDNWGLPSVRAQARRLHFRHKRNPMYLERCLSREVLWPVLKKVPGITGVRMRGPLTKNPIESGKCPPRRDRHGKTQLCVGRIAYFKAMAPEPVNDDKQSRTRSHDTVRFLGYDLIQPVRSESYEDEEVYRHIADIPLVVMGVPRP